MKLAYHEISHWPPLAWLARCSNGVNVVDVFHGSGVETGDDWFCEAVWDDVYHEAGFDRTDIVAGSGARKRGDRLIFVSSGSTVDRLQTIKVKNTYWISNSLVCLIVNVNAKLYSLYKNYFYDIGSIKYGLERYKRTLSTSAGIVTFTYFDNLVWDKKRLIQVAKPHTAPDLSTFNSYYHYMSAAMNRVSENIRSNKRSWHYSMLTTISSGYDSTAVSVLAAKAGCQEAITFLHAQDGQVDHGTAAAEALKLKLYPFERRAWHNYHFPEVPFLAGDGRGAECHFAAAGDLLYHKVLMTGFHGDGVWAMHGGSASRTLVRDNQSGLSLTEYRLWAGFIHCPVPYWGARQIQQIQTLSNSREMKPWNVGGCYSRPICRRIAEAASVSRNSFGVVKRVTSELLYASPEFLLPDSMADYVQWLAGEIPHFGFTRVRLGMLADKLFYKTIQQLEQIGSATERYVKSRSTLHFVILSKMLARLSYLGYYTPLITFRRHVFPWAVEHYSQRYGTSVIKDLLENPGCSTKL